MERGARQILVSPRNHFQQKRKQGYALFGEAVNRFLFMGRIARPGNDPLLDKPPQPVGQDIRCDAFHRLGEEFAEMPSIHEKDVAEDEQGPLIAKQFDGLVDDAFRPWIRAHAALNFEWTRLQSFYGTVPLVALYNWLCYTTAQRFRGSEYAPVLSFPSS